MKFAAFFRNLNLGRPPAPTRTALEQAFLFAGAKEPASFLSNGTLVFAAPSLKTAQTILKKACSRLHAASGFAEPAFLRSVGNLAELIAQEPFRAVDRGGVYDCYVTFLHPDLGLPPEPPRANTKGDVAVIEYTGAEMLSIAHKFGASPGSPNAFAEKAFGKPATTRAWNTVVRLVRKHAGAVG